MLRRWPCLIPPAISIDTNRIAEPKLLQDLPKLRREAVGRPLGHDDRELDPNTQIRTRAQRRQNLRAQAVPYLRRNGARQAQRPCCDSRA